MITISSHDLINKYYQEMIKISKYTANSYYYQDGESLVHDFCIKLLKRDKYEFYNKVHLINSLRLSLYRYNNDKNKKRVVELKNYMKASKDFEKIVTHVEFMDLFKVLKKPENKELLLFYQGYSYLEIAAEVNETLAAIKGRIFRSRVYLKKLKLV